MKYCANCGVKLGERAKFCQKCGTQVVSSEETEATPIKQSVPKNSIKEKPAGFEDINQQLALENNQQPIMKKSLITAGVFGVLMILPFMEWSPVAGFWALSMISLLFFLTSLVVAWMFQARSEKLETLISGENLLAEWRLTPQQKEAYINYFYQEEKGRNMAILVVISVIAVIVFGIFILFIDEGQLAMIGVLVGLILFLSFFAFVMPIYYRSSNRKGDGRILIGAKYAYINGYFHNWDFLLSGLSKIKIIKEPFYGIYLVYYYTDSTLEHSEEIYIPANDDVDLEDLISKMKESNPKRSGRKAKKKKRG